MRRLFCMVLIAVFPGTALGQSGFSTDLLDFSPSAGGLLTARSGDLTSGRFEVMLGGDWSYRLMGLENSDLPTLWIVEQRLSMRVAVAYTPTDSLRLAAGFSGAPLQEGLRYNRVGALVSMQAAMGASWVEATWGVWRFGGLPVDLALASRLMIPTAAPVGLSGGPRMDMRIEALLSARLWILRPVLNLGVATRPRTTFFDLIRDDGLICRLGLEAGDGEWPVRPVVELAGETALRSFLGRRATLLEGIIGLRIPAVAGLEVQIGAGFGLAGVGAPAVRGILLARWIGQAEKRDGLPE